jgi:hypothetical protein
MVLQGIRLRDLGAQVVAVSQGCQELLHNDSLLGSLEESNLVNSNILTKTTGLTYELCDGGCGGGWSDSGRLFDGFNWGNHCRAWVD